MNEGLPVPLNLLFVGRWGSKRRCVDEWVSLLLSSGGSCVKKYIIEIANPEPDGELNKPKLWLMQKPRTTAVKPLLEHAKCQVMITGTGTSILNHLRMGPTVCVVLSRRRDKSLMTGHELESFGNECPGGVFASMSG